MSLEHWLARQRRIQGRPGLELLEPTRGSGKRLPPAIIDELGDPVRRAITIHQDCGPICTAKGTRC